MSGKNVYRQVTEALRKADENGNGYPDYEELARVAIKTVRRVLKDGK